MMSDILLNIGWSIGLTSLGRQAIVAQLPDMMSDILLNIGWSIGLMSSGSQAIVAQ